MSSKDQQTMKTVTNSELLDIVAYKADYMKYQVEDILYVLAVVLAEELKKGNNVKLSGIGTFSQRVIKPKVFMSNLTKKEVQSSGGLSASLKIDGYMRNALNTDKENTNG